MGAIIIEHLRYPDDGSILQVDRLRIEPNERLIVFGPAGSGKSTLLRVLAGTLPGGPGVETSYLPQVPYLFRGQAGWNMTLGLDDEQAKRARILADRFGVGDLLDEPAQELRSDQRHLVALARTLARPEPWVLLDEPLASVAVSDRGRVAEGIIEALDGRGAVITTRQRDEAAQLGHQVAVIIGGRLVQHGPVGEVYARPAAAEVARELGVNNVLHGVVTAKRKPLVEVRIGPIRLWGVGDLVKGAPCRALFGAEVVSIGAGSTLGRARNRWLGEVTDLRDAGRLVRVVADVGIDLVAVFTPKARAAVGLAEGTKVTVAVAPGVVRVLPG